MSNSEKKTKSKKKTEETPQVETHAFQTEVSQLLHLFIHSLYSQKEIFVRELISNAADALDKVRFLELSEDVDILDKGADLGITIKVDEKKKTFSITDNGIGMTKEELLSNIGTIAKSGSLEFIKKLKDEKEKADMNLIGQFGVGFYSVFMVADEVVLRTRSFKPSETAWEWRCKGEGDFTVAPCDKTDRGTEIIVTLKEEEQEFAKKERINEVIKKHSGFVPFDITVNDESVVREPALWTRPKSELKKEDYTKFYQYLTNATTEPMESIHVVAEGNLEFKAVLYIPDRNHEMQGFGKVEHGLALYCNKVLIIPDCKKLLPDYLRFVRGVVDSEDLSLNVSREMLQDSALLAKIKSNLTKKVLSTLEKMGKKEPERYATFWKEFGRILKEALNSDFENRDKLQELLRFNSSSCEDSEGLVSLGEYVERFVEGQSEIYYASGADRETIERSAYLEIFNKKGVEVLYATEPMDDFILSSLMVYKEKQIRSVDDANLAALDKLKNKDGKEDEKEKDDKTSEDDASFTTFLTFVKETLGDKVKDAKRSHRLTNSPCVLVNEDGSMSLHMQKVMKMVDKNYQVSPKVIELNAEHPMVKNLAAIHEKNAEEPFLKLAVFQMFEAALLQEGVVIDPKEMPPRIFELLHKASDWCLHSSAE